MEQRELASNWPSTLLNLIGPFSSFPIDKERQLPLSFKHLLTLLRNKGRKIYAIIRENCSLRGIAFDETERSQSL